MNSGNLKNSSYAFGPSPWARPEPLRPSRPAGAHLGPTPGAARPRHRRRQALPWRASHSRRGPVCLFKAPPPPPRTLVVPRTSPCTATAACKPPQWPRRSSRALPLDSPPRARTEQNRRHQEHPLAETSPFRRSPSPEMHRTAAAAWRPSRPPWPTAAGRIPAAPAPLLRRWARNLDPLGLLFLFPKPRELLAALVAGAAGHQTRRPPCPLFWTEGGRCGNLASSPLKFLLIYKLDYTPCIFSCLTLDLLDACNQIQTEPVL
jgi:hypothetical protein